MHEDYTAIRSALSVQPLALELGYISEKVRVIIIPIRETLHNMAFSSADEKSEQRTNSIKLFEFEKCLTVQYVSWTWKQYRFIGKARIDVISLVCSVGGHV